MTLRDISDWVARTYDAFLSDLDIVFTTSLLDWPLYMVLLAIPVAFLAMMVVGVIFIIPAVIWQEYWKKHFDLEGNPLTAFGRAVDRILDVLYSISIAMLVWVAVGFGVVLVSFDGQGYVGASTVAKMAAFVLPTIVAGFVAFLMIRKRLSKAKEKDGVEKTSA